MSMRDQLIDLGIKVNDLIGGFAGGLVSALIMRHVTFWEALCSVVVGALTANYLTPVARRSLELGDGASFIIGLTAMIICQSLIELVRKWHNINR